MYFGNIKDNDISNGPGIRVSLYVSGCRNKCIGCFNKETWDFKYGKEFTDDTLNYLLDLCDHDYIKGLTILGGEPFEPENQETVLKVIKEFKKRYPNKDIWMFTGYTLDNQIKKWCENLEYTRDIISNIDVLVDGRFMEDLKDPSLAFRGSSNQRIIDIKETIKQNKIIYHKKQNKELKIWK